ncbi:MAG: PIN domain-containing protein [Rhodanobacteraceae bacterium]
MRAIDTNVLVRLLARDDLAQTRIAEAFVAKGAWVPLLALAETVWVLDTVYQRKAEQIALAISMLLSHQQLVLERSDIVAAALAQFEAKPRAGFSDCLILEIARAAGHLPLGTFDKPLARREGAQLLG